MTRSMYVARSRMGQPNYTFKADVVRQRTVSC